MRTEALVDPCPGLAAAEHAAEGAALDAPGVGALQRNRGIIGSAGVRIENPAAPFVLAGLHVDQNLFAILVRLLVDGISAEIGAALFDPDLAFLLFRQPDAERRIRGLRGSRRRSRRGGPRGHAPGRARVLSTRERPLHLPPAAGRPARAERGD